MSRIGKKPIAIPKVVKIGIVGNVVSVQGPKGQAGRDGAGRHSR